MLLLIALPAFTLQCLIVMGFFHMLRVLWDGLWLRCPHCRRGAMFASLTTMHTTCPNCGTPFERSSGEVSGGMMINLVFTETVVVLVGGSLALFTTYPLWTIILPLLLFAILFPILFYRSSRGLWASILYLTGANLEHD